MFDEVLQTIGSLSRSIVFLDECEGIFRSRGPMMNYASVTVTTKVELIDDFLTWVDGLQGQKESHVMAGAFLCLSTNVLEHIDPAVVSRSSCLKIDLPGLPERQAWWAAHAKHLVMPELAELASITEGLSFRDLAQVAEKVERAAARHAGLDAQVKHCSISQYRDVSRKLAEDKGSAETRWGSWDTLCIPLLGGFRRVIIWESLSEGFERAILGHSDLSGAPRKDWWVACSFASGACRAAEVGSQGQAVGGVLGCRVLLH